MTKTITITLSSDEQGMLLAALIDKALTCENKQVSDSYRMLYGDIQEALINAKPNRQ